MIDDLCALSPGELGRPAFCTVTQKPGHGGIARVSSLISTCLEHWLGDRFQLFTLLNGNDDRPTLWRKLAFAERLLQAQLQRRPDWVLFDHLQLATVQNLVPRAFRRPYAIFLHSIEVWNPLSPIRKQALLGAGLLIANSSYTARRVKAAHPEVKDIQVCHLALPRHSENSSSGTVDSDLISRIRPNSVLIVGRILLSEGHKGHEQLIRTWPSVVRVAPDGQLVIVGHGDAVPKLKELAAASGARSSIFFTGRVSDATLKAIYPRVAVFAMPSSAEGFGIVYLEAMRNRLPCIGGQDAAGEIIADGETGFLVDPSDPAELTKRLADLLTDPSLRIKMGNAGFDRLNAHFSFENFEHSLGQILSGFAGRTRSSK